MDRLSGLEEGSLMQIERVSKYVNGGNADRSTSSRRVWMSLPRVRWLERDPERPGQAQPEIDCVVAPVEFFDDDDDIEDE
jgi:hypothetical protein